MLTRHLALVSQTSKISPSELAQVSAALQKQASGDLAPLWSISATVDAFPNLSAVPPGYWPIIIKDDIGEAGAAGFHTDDSHQPYALVEYSTDWPITASHEALEALIDPWGSRLHAAKSIRPGEGIVRYLIEVADPPEAQGYEIDGVPVSDFVTPAYYGSGRMQEGTTRFDFLGLIKQPKTLLFGGYISWLNAGGQWEQATWFSGDHPKLRTLGKADASMSLRAFIDRNTQSFKAKSL